MTTMAARDAMPSQASCVFHSPARPGCSIVAEAIAVMPITASASAAAIVGTSSLSSSRRLSNASLGVGPQVRLQRGDRVLGREPLLEEDLEHLAGGRRRRRSTMAAVLDDDRESHLGLLRRRVADEPRVIAPALRV